MVQQRAVPLLKGGHVGLTPSLQEIIGWEYNAVLTHLAYRLVDGLWTAIIKADFGSNAMVAFVDVGSFARCVEVANEVAARGNLRWHRDKYPPKTRRYKKAL